MAIIETSDLRKSFKTHRRVVEALRSVNLCVQAGEIFGLLGPNGAGKTTTLRMLTTLLAPSSGQATVAGYDLLREPARVRARIGYVSQVGGLDSSATGRENLILQAQLYGMNRVAARSRAVELINAFRLEAFADRIAWTYSGGQRRRFDLALGMVNRPAVLFLDEPTTGLDPRSRAWLWDEVRAMRAAGTSVFITTHYLDEADALCDRLAIVDDGRVVAEGTPEALKRQVAGDVVTLGLNIHNGELQRAQNLLRAQPFVREIQVHYPVLLLYVERGEEALPTILRLLDSADLSIQTIALARPTLDDVFLRKTGRSLRNAEERVAQEPMENGQLSAKLTTDG